MALYKQTHNDWFTLRGAMGVKLVVQPGEVVDTNSPPDAWMNAYSILMARGNRNLDAKGDFYNEVKHWTKGRNPIFMQTTQAALNEEARLRKAAADYEALKSKKTSKKDVTTDDE
jgi:hypothetical protein